jgi:hypothetical protein
MNNLIREELYHGMEVTCQIYDTYIDNAKISINENGDIYICQNKIDDNIADNTLEYNYSWQYYYNGFRPNPYDRNISNLQPKNKIMEDKEFKVKQSRILEAARTCGTTKEALKIMFPEAFEQQEKNINVVTEFPSPKSSKLRINDKWVASIHHKEYEDEDYDGAKIAGHKSSIFLTNCSGKWYTEQGVEVHGYLFFKPRN